MHFEDIDIDTAHELTDAKEITRIIMDPDEQGIITQWAQYGHLFLSAYIIHLMKDETPTLSTIRNHLMEMPYDVLLNDMLYSSSKTVNDVALTLLKEPENFQEKYVQTALNAVEDYMARQERYTAI